MAARSVLLVVAMLSAALLGGCQSTLTGAAVPDPKLTARDAEMMALAPPDEARIPTARYQVPDPTGEAPGTIVVDTAARNLYFVLPGKQAILYRVATGAEAYGWTGEATVGRMAEWPTWMPTESIMERWPEFRPIARTGRSPAPTTTPWAPARSIFTKAITTRSTAFMAPTNPAKSARAFLPAASACATLT